MKKLWLFFPLLFLFCSRNTDVLESQSEIRMQPESGYFGSEVVFTGVQTEATESGIRVVFAGMTTTFSPVYQGHDTLIARVPYGAKSGTVELFVNTKKYVFENFTVLEEVPDAVEVKHYNLARPITEEEAMLDSFDGPMPWEGATKKDTLILTNSGLCGDECNYRIDLRFVSHTAADLPVFIDLIALQETFDYYIVRDTFRLERGIIKIQDYNPDGLVSGQVYSELWPLIPLTFWYDFGQK